LMVGASLAVMVHGSWIEGCGCLVGQRLTPPFDKDDTDVGIGIPTSVLGLGEGLPVVRSGSRSSECGSLVFMPLMLSLVLEHIKAPVVSDYKVGA
jgi:hypothetical protein